MTFATIWTEPGDIMFSEISQKTNKMDTGWSLSCDKSRKEDSKEGLE